MHAQKEEQTPYGKGTQQLAIQQIANPSILFLANTLRTYKQSKVDVLRACYKTTRLKKKLGYMTREKRKKDCECTGLVALLACCHYRQQISET